MYYIDTYKYTYTYTFIHIYSHPDAHIQMRCARSYTYTYTHKIDKLTHRYTCPNAYIQIHVCLCICNTSPNVFMCFDHEPSKFRAWEYSRVYIHINKCVFVYFQDVCGHICHQPTKSRACIVGLKHTCKKVFTCIFMICSYLFVTTLRNLERGCIFGLIYIYKCISVYFHDVCMCIRHEPSKSRVWVCSQAGREAPAVCGAAASCPSFAVNV